MTMMLPLPGDPDILDTSVTRFDDVAGLLRDTARQLRGLADDDGQAGDAIRAVRGEVGTTADGLDRAEPRYTETAAALREYSTVLADAQRRVNGAIDQVEELTPQLQRLEEESGDLNRERWTAPIDEWDERGDDIDRVDAQMGPLRDRIADAQAEYDRAVRDQDEAGWAAIARIANILDEGRDSWWDDIVDGWDGFIDGLAAIGDWLANTLVPILLTVVLALELLAIGLVAVALVLALLPLSLALLGGLLLANDGDWDALVDDLLAAGIVVLPVLSAALGLMLFRESVTGTPPLTAIDPAGGRLRARPPRNADDEVSDTPYQDLFDENVRLDKDGTTEETRIRVVEVLNAKGERVGWRVILPSTQDWEGMNPFMNGGFPDDRGGVNDLGSNLALMLTPEQEAAYQRAVIDAMNEAGVQENDPVMLAGWSQGGILAARLAASDQTPGDVQAIVVAGSPIDTIPIPSDVSVLSLQHQGDIVHRLDGAAPSGGRPNWQTVLPPGENPHDGGVYAESAGRYLDGHGGPVDPAVDGVAGDQSPFFSDYDGGSAVENTYSVSEAA